ncbi:MAG: proton-conducting transporter membrane subunit [Solirubrobacterales bacterium]
MLGRLLCFALVGLRRHQSRGPFSGLARTHPWWSLALVVSLLSLVGIPPLAGFVAKPEPGLRLRLRRASAPGQRGVVDITPTA